MLVEEAGNKRETRIVGEKKRRKKDQDGRRNSKIEGT